MLVKFKRTNSFAKTPVYATSGAACFDLHAVSINGSMNIGDIVYEGHPVICDTGLAFAVPVGYMLAIRSRSGLAFNHGIHAFHGTVDSDYTGSVKVLLMAEPRDDETPPFRINPGDRIAQACIIPVPMVAFEEVDELPTTELGAAGFGSTGGR